MRNTKEDAKVYIHQVYVMYSMLNTYTPVVNLVIFLRQFDSKNKIFFFTTSKVISIRYVGRLCV